MDGQYLHTGFLRLCWDNLLRLIALNLLFLVCCLPVLTIPAAFTALNRACQSLLYGENSAFRQFFRSLKANIISALPLGLLFALSLAVLIYGCLFYYNISGGKGMAIAAAIFCLVCVYILYCAGIYAFAMLARVELKTASLLRNAFILTFRNTSVVKAWGAASFALFTLFAAFFPYSTPVLCLLGFSLPCFAASRGALPVIDDLIVRSD